MPQPTATGRAILRMWIEDQLKLIAARRHHARTWRRHQSRRNRAA